MTRANLAHASKGDTAFDTRRSRLRTGLVALQIGACALFLIGAAGLVDESRHVANADAGLNYARVASVRVDVRIRANVATHLASDPSVERVAAAWQPPLVSPLQTTGMVASETNITRAAGFIVVSPDYFPLFDLRITRGRAFTTQEADDNAAVVLVSEATAQAFWPGRDPIGQTLTLVPGEGRSQRRPSHTSVRVIGVAHDVTSGTLLDGTDTTCVYFATGFRSPGELSLLVRGRADVAPTKTAVTAAVTALDPDAAFQFYTMREFMGAITWVLQAISVGASLIGSVGLLLAFSGTYAVVAFLVTQRMREFGIRMALGATVRQIVSGLLRETLRTASIGIGGGVMVSLALVLTFRAAFSVVPAFAVRPYAVGIGIVFIATMTAALFPSLRAARTDPSRALRVD